MLLLAGAAPALSPDTLAPGAPYESFDPRQPPRPVVEQVARRYRIGEAAAERTVNAASDPSTRYARKVFAERDLLRQTYE